MAESSLAENVLKPKVSTLVFMDLETTGLPFDVGKRNVQITEMSLIAIDRNSFEGDNSLRVLNKLSLCIRPRSVISPGSMNITGLYNDILENQEEFDDSVPKLLEYFFRRLQKPICLLAHNGDRFDFPLLQAELNRLNYALGSDIVCADTLVAFRAICQSKKQAETEAKSKEKEETKTNKQVDISDEDIDNLLSQDMDYFSSLHLHPIEEKEILISEDKIEANGVCESENEFVPPQEFTSISEDEKTPSKNKIPSLIKPDIKNRKRKILDPTFHPKNQYKKKAVSVKRALFPNKADTPPPDIHKITKFSLTHIYNFIFNEDPPQSHYAEGDCISLSKVCQKIKEDFLHWVDDNNVAFSVIDPFW